MIHEWRVQADSRSLVGYGVRTSKKDPNGQWEKREMTKLYFILFTNYYFWSRHGCGKDSWTFTWWCSSPRWEIGQLLDWKLQIKQGFFFFFGIMSPEVHEEGNYKSDNNNLTCSVVVKIEIEYLFFLVFLIVKSYD